MYVNAPIYIKVSDCLFTVLSTMSSEIILSGKTPLHVFRFTKIVGNFIEPVVGMTLDPMETAGGELLSQTVEFHPKFAVRSVPKFRILG